MEEATSNTPLCHEGSAYLGNSHFKVFLCDMHPSLPQRVHASFCAHPLQGTEMSPTAPHSASPAATAVPPAHLHFCARRPWHQLRNLPQIDAPRQVHFPGVDLEDVQASLRESSSKARVGAAGIVPKQGWGQCTPTREIRGPRESQGVPWGTPPTSSLGGGNSIFLSMRPGRSRAESRMSIRFVAMITCTGRTTVTIPDTLLQPQGQQDPGLSPGRDDTLLP